MIAVFAIIVALFLTPTVQDTSPLAFWIDVRTKVAHLSRLDSELAKRSALAVETFDHIESLNQRLDLLRAECATLGPMALPAIGALQVTAQVLIVEQELSLRTWETSASLDPEFDTHFLQPTRLPPSACALPGALRFAQEPEAVATLCPRTEARRAGAKVVVSTTQKAFWNYHAEEVRRL